jgi:DNA-binding LytR/AlgR family response regulator
MSVTTDQIAYFEGEDRYVYLTKKDGARYIIDYKLSELEDLLDPRNFYRLNRSFIARFECIKSIYTLSKSRVKIELEPTARREIMVSSENTQDFKRWLNQ